MQRAGAGVAAAVGSPGNVEAAVEESKEGPRVERDGRRGRLRRSVLLLRGRGRPGIASRHGREAVTMGGRPEGGQFGEFCGAGAGHERRRLGLCGLCKKGMSCPVGVGRDPAGPAGSERVRTRRGVRVPEPAGGGFVWNFSGGGGPGMSALAHGDRVLPFPRSGVTGALLLRAVRL